MVWICHWPISLFKWPSVTHADAEGVDRARSATEAFLYRRLETLPQTVGRFHLNALLSIPFDISSQMEVDLLCADARLAVELDGAQHLADANAYRRDRRKDALLQQNGYMVLRFLSEDVGKHLDDVLDSILRGFGHIKKKRDKHMGRYCRICDRVRSNESFSGGGHKNCICKKCQKLPKEELNLIRVKDELLGYWNQSNISKLNHKMMKSIRRSNVWTAYLFDVVTESCFYAIFTQSVGKNYNKMAQRSTIGTLKNR